jgi:DNA-binding protein HU-beta
MPIKLTLLYQSLFLPLQKNLIYQAYFMYNLFEVEIEYSVSLLRKIFFLEEKIMNKTAIIEKMAKDLGMTKADAKRAFELIFDQITLGLKKGSVSVPQFGTFKTSKRKARTGRNPQTGAEIKIPARTAITFKASTVLKSKFNK